MRTQARVRGLVAAAVALAVVVAACSSGGSEKVKAVAYPLDRRLRLNEVQVVRDMGSAAIKAEVKKNLDLARALGVTGTPTYVIGNKILSGAVGYAELKKAIEDARAKR